MIDFASERLMTLAEASRLLPRRRGGRSPHVSCLYRWSTSGCRGVVLETVQIGGTRCTSIEALARFFAELDKTTPRPKAPAPAGEPLDERVAAAEQELAEPPQ